MLARFSGGDAALTEQAVGQGRLIVFTSDLDNAVEPLSVESGFRAVRGRNGAVSDAEHAAGHGRAEAAAACDARESNPAATTVEEFTNAIERTNRAGLLEAENAARDIEDRQRWWQIGLS